MGTTRSPACLVPGLVLLVLQTSAQPAAVPAPPGVVAATPISTSKAPLIFTAVNPPACAQEFADFMNHMSFAVVDIIYSTRQCAYNMGWYGQLPNGNKQMTPFHTARGCASLLIDMFASLFASVSDLEASAFDCFNDNQACGQAIASTARRLLEGTGALVFAAGNCAPPGGNPPWISSGYDVPASGFFCWSNIVHFAQRMLKSSKYIDVAIGTCDTTPPTPVPVATPPTPTGDASANSSAPTPTADGSANSTAPKPTGDAPVPTAVDSTSAPAPNASLGASWNSLQQPQPFKGMSTAETAPAERRLSVAATTAGAAGFAKTHDHLKETRDGLVEFLRASGAVSMTEAQTLMGWTFEEFQDIIPLVDAFVEGFAAAQVANDTIPTLV